MANRRYRLGQRHGHQAYDPGPFRVVSSYPAPVVLPESMRRDRETRIAEMTPAERSRFYNSPRSTEGSRA